MIWDVVGVGASCIDHVCRLPVFPKAGGALSKVRVHVDMRGCGGQTASALATCRRLGLSAKYIGAVGDDDNGRQICQELEARGIDVADVVRSHSPSATATILIDDSGDRIVLWHRAPGLSVVPAGLPRAALAAARLVHVDDVDEPAAIESARIARSAGVAVTSDIDHVTSRTDELLSLVSIPILAEHLPRQLTGEADDERALRALRNRHPGLLVVTRGVRGALALEGEIAHRIPAYRVSAVDTTGAGDVFRGGFIYAILQGWTVPDGLRFANAAAAASCQKLGAMNGVPSMDETRLLLERGDTYPLD